MKRDVFRAHINYETIAKLFFDIAEERYPSAEKIIQLASRMVDPISTDSIENIHVKITLLNAIRDMIKEVSPTRIYRSFQHRDDLYLAVIEALEDLEDELEEIEEKELEEEERAEAESQ